MSDDGAAADRSEQTAHHPAAREGERARRRARVFGDVLPETTCDERSAGGAAGEEGDGGGEEWLRANVPPHHGT